MKTTDFRPQVSSSKLQENIAKQFGKRVNLEKYDREQLEDMRNKLRTRVFQYEGAKGFNDLLHNESYQQDKAMLELLNTRIKEMLGEDIKKLRDKMVELSEGKKGVKVAKHPRAAKGAKPDFIDADKDGNKKEPMKAAVKSAKAKKADESIEEGWDDMMKSVKDKAGPQPNGGAGVKKGKAYGGSAQKDEKEPEEKKSKKVKEAAKKAKKDYDGDGKVETDKDEVWGSRMKAAKKAGKLKESFKQHVRMVNEGLARFINEDEEGKAKAITAAGDMVNDFTSWMQRVGQYQTKTMIELADAIKADFGAQEAEQFKQAVAPALSQTLEVLTQQREAISGAVAVLAGEASPMDAMGAEPGMDAGMPPEPGMDAAGPDMMNPEPAGDEFGASDAAAGGPEAAGRAMRESKEQRKARKLAEAHSIMAKLAK